MRIASMLNNDSCSKSGGKRNENEIGASRRQSTLLYRCHYAHRSLLSVADYPHDVAKIVIVERGCK